jgi:histidine triad (HIT) family protein
MYTELLATTSAGMENCIFCQIVAGLIPAHKVYEDEYFLAFLDINPEAPGHCQVVPKKHYRWVWDVPAEAGVPTGPTIGAYFAVAQKIALAQRKAFHTDFIISRIVGDEVPHAHIWVFPGGEVAGDKKDFEGNKQKIISQLN